MRPYLNAMQRYFEFKGRSTRSQYWYFMLTLFILFIIPALFDAPPVVTGIIQVVHLIPNLAVTVRRLHDTNRSGWWVLTGPIALIFLIGASTAGANRFGPRPMVGNQTEPPIAAPTAVDSLYQLERLASLKASGAIDDDEFRQMKVNVMTKPAN